ARSARSTSRSILAISRTIRTAFRCLDGARRRPSDAALRAPRRVRPIADMVIFVWLRRRWPWLSLALNGVLAIVLARPLFRPNREMFGSQPKGDFDIVVFARHDGRVERLDRYNRWVHPGDDVRFVLTGTPDDHGHIIVDSLDA